MYKPKLNAVHVPWLEYRASTRAPLKVSNSHELQFYLYWAGKWQVSRITVDGQYCVAAVIAMQSRFQSEFEKNTTQSKIESPASCSSETYIPTFRMSDISAYVHFPTNSKKIETNEILRSRWLIMQPNSSKVAYILLAASLKASAIALIAIPRPCVLRLYVCMCVCHGPC